MADARLGRALLTMGRHEEAYGHLRRVAAVWEREGHSTAAPRLGWLNYDLGAEGGAEGQWSATRIED